jgi:hypothetical protein
VESQGPVASQSSARVFCADVADVCDVLSDKHEVSAIAPQMASATARNLFLGAADGL